MGRSRKGFTVVEMLIVVAIIAVLAAVAIPIFAAYLEKSRESVDFANVRSAYSQVLTAAATEDTDAPSYVSDGYYLIDVPLKQAEDGWATNMRGFSIGGIAYTDDVHWLHDPAAGGVCQVYYKNGSVFIDWGGGAKSPLPSSGRQTHINSISAQEFLTKDILSSILPANYPYTVINSNETVLQNGGTKLFLDYAAEKGFDLSSNYGATSWQIYAKEPGTGSFLDQPAIYWSSLTLDEKTLGSNVPVIGYRNGKYDVYMAKVDRYNSGERMYYSLANGFANVTNANEGMGGSATFQFDSYEEAMKKYNAALKIYEESGSLTKEDMKKLGL